MTRLALPPVLLCLAVASAPGELPPPKTVGPVETFGVNVQRSMNLIAGSTGLKRNTVRVLFYGQSHIVSDWTRLLAERMRRQYPLVDFVIENRAISGFTSEWLVRTAEADLYSFYPDLVILHDYGDASCLESLIRRLRERTTSEMILLTDHIAPRVEPKGEEITDPLRLSEPKGGRHDASWRSYVFLPELAKKYRLELVDVRGLWKRYLADHKLNASDLLYDELHLNLSGNRLMADLVAPHLRHRPDLAPHFDDPVVTHTVGEGGDLQWKDGKLRLDFTGNKVDLICREVATRSEPVPIRIDGKKPSEFPQLYGFTRTALHEPVHRELPPVVRVMPQAPLVIEDWTMHISQFDREKKTFRFRIVGSITGDDGAGEVGREFVSNSKRVVMDPIDMHFVPITIEKSSDPNATSAVIRWKSVGYFADEFVVPEKRNAFGETVVVAAQGLPNGKHVIEIAGGPETPIAAIRTYRPTLPESPRK